MNKRFPYFLVVLISSVLFASCFTAPPTKTEKKVTSSIYNPFMYRLHPEYVVYCQSKNKSLLYTKIYLSELLFSPMGPKKKYRGKIKIEYKIFPAENPEQLIDSASAEFTIRKQKGQNNIISYIKLKDQSVKKYYLQITTTDMLRRVKVQNYIYVDKEDDGSRQNFIVSSKKTKQPYFKNFFRPDHFFSIKHNNPVDSIYIKYYLNEIPLPYPPFASLKRSDINTVSDSIWSVSGKTAFQFHEEKKGFYFLQTDSTSSYGLGMVNPGEHFPYIKTSDAMVKPLQYLTSTDEYNDLITSSNKKLAVDRFWLGCGKNSSRARELIRIYYNRSLYANIYFTSFTQGWRTDRGMIYLVFGPPKAVKKYPTKEVWLYGDRMHYKVLQFVFNRVDNNYTDNDFVLERHIDFKKFWFSAIKSWRGGTVYDVFQ
ncbi:MAG: GWxTD domain-containing protein [Bacteroidota bacterium]